MNLLICIAVTVVVVVIVAALVVLLLPRRNPCYRCGGLARCEYMALHYCWICRDIVMRMMPMVGMGGMFGFPGAPGYLEFPVDTKKEVSDG